jgi:putative sigma-54 modulation protein
VQVEVTVYSKNGTFRAEEHEGSLYAAIDKTADKLARTLRKRKVRVHSPRTALAPHEHVLEASENRTT